MSKTRLNVCVREPGLYASRIAALVHALNRIPGLEPKTGDWDYLIRRELARHLQIGGPSCSSISNNGANGKRRSLWKRCRRQPTAFSNSAEAVAHELGWNRRKPSD
jgi:hypothetical protein